MAKVTMKTWDLYWSPTGQKIDTVQASNAKMAKRKAPAPYKKYKGEIYVQEVKSESNPFILNNKSSDWIPVQAIRRTSDGGIQISVSKGTLSNPARKKSFMGKIRKLFSNPGPSKYTIRKKKNYYPGQTGAGRGYSYTEYWVYYGKYEEGGPLRTKEEAQEFIRSKK
jgi:hypothetical protein